MPYNMELFYDISILLVIYFRLSASIYIYFFVNEDIQKGYSTSTTDQSASMAKRMTLRKLSTTINPKR